MKTVVQKYGGSSVATPEKLRQVAELVVARKRSGVSLCVVVSAMGDTTDELLELAKKLSENPPRRELDMLLSCGERISMALLAMAISALGEEVISFTGSQSGIITDDNHFAAKIVRVQPQRIEQALADGKIVIVAGYQGMSTAREITTLGRGGSDTSAVALAAALDALACEIYSDVDGVFSADPRVVAEATRIPKLSYREMETLAIAGAQVLNADAVAFARQRNIVIHAKKTGVAPSAGTRVTASAPRSRAVAGVAHKREVWEVQAPDASAALAAFLRYGAKPEACTIDGNTLHCVADLENLADSAGLAAKLHDLGAQTRAVDIVSLVGEALGQQHAIVARAIALAKAATRITVETHRLAAIVSQGAGAALCQSWHHAFAR